MIQVEPMVNFSTSKPRATTDTYCKMLSYVPSTLTSRRLDRRKWRIGGEINWPEGNWIRLRLRVIDDHRSRRNRAERKD